MNALFKTREPWNGYDDIDIERKQERELAIERLSERLYEQERQDLGSISDGLADWLWYDKRNRNDPVAMEVMKLIRDGADDLELGRLIRVVTLKKLAEDCVDKATDAIDNPEEYVPGESVS